MNIPLQISHIREAAERIRLLTHRTPVMTCEAINNICQANIFFKCENFQKVGAFKARGAVNAVFSLSDSAASKGVATHSSGNHAAALAYAARSRGIKAYVVMPQNAPAIKKAAVAGYSADISFCQPTQNAREKELLKIVEQTGAAFVHPYNDYSVIAGQATAALELFGQVRDLGTIIVPISGGGLISGTALTAAALNPETAIIGVEPAGADDACRSIRAGRIIPVENPETIADGLRASLGTITFPLIQKFVKTIVTVSEDAIAEAMRLIFERVKIVVEPSSAVTLAALLEKRGQIPGDRIALLISGGNVDLEKLPFNQYSNI